MIASSPRSLFRGMCSPSARMLAQFLGIFYYGLQRISCGMDRDGEKTELIGRKPHEALQVNQMMREMTAKSVRRLP